MIITMNSPGSSNDPLPPDLIARAAAAVRRARALIFTAGAGMGVDSGLPDFRGNQGFWRAYPVYQHLGLDFAAMANPRWFQRDPAFAWGFYGHRLNLYRDTVPHAGFAVLRALAAAAPGGAFVFTSNVDGQFQRAGFAESQVVECHGSIHHLQCLAGCGQPLFPADGARVTVDPETLRAAAPLPACPRCGGLARPNILMFGDGGWDDERAAAQEERLRAFLRGVDGPLCVIECGAGTAIPTVRSFSEDVARRGALVRINPREPEIDSRGAARSAGEGGRAGEGGAQHVSIRSGAAAALLALGAALSAG